MPRTPSAIVDKTRPRYAAGHGRERAGRWTARFEKLLSLAPSIPLIVTWLRRGPAEARREWSWWLQTRPRGLPRRCIEELFDVRALHLQLAHVGGYASQGLHETACLATIAAATQPSKVLEIGTFRGATTHLLAVNAPRATVYTLDLPLAGTQPLWPVTHVDDEITTARGSAMLYADAPEAPRIVQLRGDSATFDFDCVGDEIDLAFIDGAHSYDYVRGDTEQVLRRMRPGGVIVWDDYSDLFPGVVRYLNSLRTIKRFSIWGTKLVVGFVPNPSTVGTESNGRERRAMSAPTASVRTQRRKPDAKTCGLL